MLSLHADPTTTVGAPENGGVTIYVREVAAALAADGWTVDVVTRRQAASEPAAQYYRGFRVVRVDAGPAAPLANDEIAAHLRPAVEAVRGLCRATRYDFVSSHYWLSGAIGMEISAEFGLPHVHTPHSHGVERVARDPVTLRRIEIERALLRDVPIVTLSDAHVELHRTAYGVAKVDAHVVPAGVDTARFFPGDRVRERVELGLDPDAIWVGYIGRLTPEKGIDDLLRALAIARERGSTARLFVVGGAAQGSRIPELGLLAERLGIAAAVRFVGPIPNAAIAGAFRAADVVAVPSHYEAFGMVALEARATGVPVIASDVGGLRSLVGPETGGDRVPARDPIAWADALERAFAPGELADRRRRALEMRGEGVLAWIDVARRVAGVASDTLARG
ncbi:MAG TPA: glycosyltransferase [Candidatus Baltobacteraceae bacterium]